MTGKPSTPVLLPKVVKMEPQPPQTPPSRRQLKRLSGGVFMTTPEQVDVPFLPAVKRQLIYKSPDYKLNAHNVASPYTQGLKTPRRTSASLRGGHLRSARGSIAEATRTSGGSEIDNAAISLLDDELDSEAPAHKLQKTPQFFSPGRRLFIDDKEHQQQREELTEILSKLKNRLLLALGRIQRDKITSLKVISDISLPRALWPQVNLGEGLPLQLQTPRERTSHTYSNNLMQDLGKALDFLELKSPYQVSSGFSLPPKIPVPLAPGQLSEDNLPTKSQYLSEKQAARASAAQSLLNSPHLFSERVNIPSPDEETSAHSALMAALQRQKRRSRSSFSGNRNSLNGGINQNLAQTNNSEFQSLSQQLPSNPNSNQKPQVDSSPHKSTNRRPLQNLGQAQVSPKHNAIQTPPPTQYQSKNQQPNQSQSQQQSQKESQANFPLKLPPINVALNELKGGEEDAVLSLMSLSSPQKVQFTPSRGHSRTTSLNSTLSVGSPSHQTVLPPISGLIRRYSNTHKTDNDETDIENDETDEEADAD